MVRLASYKKIVTAVLVSVTDLAKRFDGRCSVTADPI